MATGLLFGLGALLSILGVVVGNAFGSSREKEARQENFNLNELSAENADQRTRALYEDLQSPSALRQQYEEAGLSPSIMFGGKGLGGQLEQGAQGQGASGISPTVFGTSGLEAAQIGLINAQTQKTKVETQNISTDTDLKSKEIEKVVAETKSEDLKQVWQEIQNGISQMDLNLKGEYGEQEIKVGIEKQEAEIRNLGQVLRKLTVEGDISEENKQDIINYTRGKVLKQQAELFLTRTQTQLAEAQINLTNQQATTLFEQLQYIDDYVDISKRGIKVQEDRLQAEIAQWAKQNGYTEKALQLALAKLVTSYVEQNEDQVLNILTSLISLSGKMPTKVKGLQ